VQKKLHLPACVHQVRSYHLEPQTCQLPPYQQTSQLFFGDFNAGIFHYPPVFQLRLTCVLYYITVRCVVCSCLKELFLSIFIYFFFQYSCIKLCL